MNFRSCARSEDFFQLAFVHNASRVCKLLKIKWQRTFFPPRAPFFHHYHDTLCAFITQHKLHESMRNFILEIIYHTREMIFYFVLETNLLEETSENCIKRRYIIASDSIALKALDARVQASERELLMKINLFYQLFHFK